MIVCPSWRYILKKSSYGRFLITVDFYLSERRNRGNKLSCVRYKNAFVADYARNFELVNITRSYNQDLLRLLFSPLKHLMSGFKKIPFLFLYFIEML